MKNAYRSMERMHPTGMSGNGRSASYFSNYGFFAIGRSPRTLQRKGRANWDGRGSLRKSGNRIRLQFPRCGEQVYGSRRKSAHRQGRSTSRKALCRRWNGRDRLRAPARAEHRHGRWRARHSHENPSNLLSGATARVELTSAGFNGHVGLGKVTLTIWRQMY